MQASIGPRFKTNNAQQIKAYNADVQDVNTDMPD